jgi:hypothetical protein
LKLRDAIRRKLPGQLWGGIQLRHGNADPIRPKQPRRESNNCSGDFLHIRLTARTCSLVTSSVWFAKIPPVWQMFR